MSAGVENSIAALSSAQGVITIDISVTDHVLVSASRGFYVGVSGDVKVDMADGTTFTYKSLAAGVEHSLQVKKVYRTGTTATNMGALT
jgi:hypothetical protein